MRPYSEDLRERVAQRAEAGETIRLIATDLRISRSREIHEQPYEPSAMAGCLSRAA
jgi:hypothetical protein